MTHTTGQDIIIVGAGIIGGAIAWELARRGVRVTVLDRGAVGREASYAAAGMLSPQVEAQEPSPLLHLGIAARARYPEWVRAVSQESGSHIDFGARGLLNLALTEEAATMLQSRRDWQARLGLRGDWLTGREACSLEPALREGLPGALLLPDEARVDSAALTRALAIAAVHHGARIEDHTEVTSLLFRGGRVAGVVAGNRRHTAEQVVIAAGAWSSRIEGMPFPSDWIEPARGQIVAVRRQAPIGHILYTHLGGEHATSAYLTPRGEDELLLGATVEHAGFDPQVTVGGLTQILAAVAGFAPRIAAAPVVRLAAGLRPEPRDGLPLIGPLARLPGLIMATGHFRQGILLAPVTGEMIAETIVSGAPSPALAPFLPDRVPASS
jgi:glycine oxidase